MNQDILPQQLPYCLNERKDACPLSVDKSAVYIKNIMTIHNEIT